MGKLHLIKLCVGVESLEHLRERQARRSPNTPQLCHVTRMWPRREKELLHGGSLYWVIRGSVQARQTITGLKEQIGADGIRRCAICLNPSLIPTQPLPRRPFQGWRYLNQCDAPPDIPARERAAPALPPELSKALNDLGVRVG